MQNKYSQKPVAILLLAGNGTRLYQDIQIKKQFYPLNHRELYLYALDSFLKSALFQRIVLVIDKEDQERILMNLETKIEIPEDTEVSFTFGGKDRNESVYQGFEALSDIQGEFAVFIHDAARPLISVDTLNQLNEEIQHYDALTLMLPMHDSVLKEKNGKITYVNRKDLYRVLTPQVFDYRKIKAIYDSGYNKNDTDDFKKAVVNGLACHLVRGKAMNFKVTEMDDLQLLESVIMNKED